MKVLICGGAALLCALILFSEARAQAPKTATPPAPPAQTGAPRPAPAAPAPSAPTKPAVATPAPAPAAKPVPQAAPSGLSESKYLGLLYSEIEKHTPEDNPAGPGEVTASFIVGASGRVEKVTIDKTTSPAHAGMVRKILSEVVTPPPPGGSMDIGQTFRFR